MGCPREYKIGNNEEFIFSICTHDPDTGILTDCDASPVFRIYEEEIVIPILTGTMNKLDDANTTGFYTGAIDVATVNTLQDSNNYTIYIEATVDGDTGGMCYGFKAKNLISGLVLTSASARKPKITATSRKPKITAERQS